MVNFLNIYIDESGDLGKFGSRYFTLAAIITENPLELKRIIKRIRQRKLKKKIKNLSEIKANNCDRFVREYVLSDFSKTDAVIYAIVVKKEDIIDPLFNVKDKLYNFLCGVLMDAIKTSGVFKIIITVDKKHTNTLVREDFNQYIKNKLNKKYENVKIEIYHKESHTLNELQVVDFIAWSINRKFNSQDDYYFKFIEDKIVNRDKMVIWKKFVDPRGT